MNPRVRNCATRHEWLQNIMFAILVLFIFIVSRCHIHQIGKGFVCCNPDLKNILVVIDGGINFQMSTISPWRISHLWKGSKIRASITITHVPCLHYQGTWMVLILVSHNRTFCVMLVVWKNNLVMVGTT